MPVWNQEQEEKFLEYSPVVFSNMEVNPIFPSIFDRQCSLLPKHIQHILFP